MVSARYVARAPRRATLLHRRARLATSAARQRVSGRSSVVEHDLAKVGVEGSNPFARSSRPET